VDHAAKILDNTHEENEGFLFIIVSPGYEKTANITDCLSAYNVTKFCCSSDAFPVSLFSTAFLNDGAKSFC
jgi:hypothetical protein